VTLASAGAPRRACRRAVPTRSRAPRGGGHFHAGGLHDRLCERTAHGESAALTVTANNQTKTYGSTFTFAGTEFTPNRAAERGTIGTATLTSAGAPAARMWRQSLWITRAPRAAALSRRGLHDRLRERAAHRESAALTVTANDQTSSTAAHIPSRAASSRRPGCRTRDDRQRHARKRGRGDRALADSPFPITASARAAARSRRATMRSATWTGSSRDSGCTDGADGDREQPDKTYAAPSPSRAPSSHRPGCRTRDDRPCDAVESGRRRPRTSRAARIHHGERRERRTFTPATTRSATWTGSSR